MIRFRIRRSSVLTTRERDAKKYSDCTIISKACLTPDINGKPKVRKDPLMWTYNIYVILENTKW